MFPKYGKILKNLHSTAQQKWQAKLLWISTQRSEQLIYQILLSRQSQTIAFWLFVEPEFGEVLLILDFPANLVKWHCISVDMVSFVTVSLVVQMNTHGRYSLKLEWRGRTLILNFNFSVFILTWQVVMVHLPLFCFVFFFCNVFFVQYLFCQCFYNFWCVVSLCIFNKFLGSLFIPFWKVMRFWKLLLYSKSLEKSVSAPDVNFYKRTWIQI